MTASPAAGAAADLGAALATPLWLHRTTPFPHWWARDVFTPPAYQLLEEAFRARVERRASDPKGGFARSMPTSDALALLFDPGFDGPLSLFLSRAWRDLVGAVTGMRLTEHVSGGLHHHPVGDPDGFIHSDFNVGWFVHQPREDGIVVADHTACRYGTGEPRRTGVEPRPYLRAVSVLFYLANPPWSGGGGTALFRRRDDPLHAAAAEVPPLNNSLVLFPCTPYSFHAFLGNRRHPRSSVAMWFHRTLGDAAEQWGEPATAGALRRARPR
ncbi:MAG: 2OG-Fe(II) oxygenase [Candidatus Dormibacteraeota bacterium]|uniref:2OG-Fe(II) oxygenase n=1 Tax=Candidatus Amunia macphersoniae TaxID=3127014 RepID=A0A934NGY9_9BACT|nr:2OG-Fe(II) oxygenase [Candidatus Dormibacteraeota bacterium]